MHQPDEPFDFPLVGNDLPPEIRRYMIQLLQQTLLWTVDLRSQVKEAGWNVTGPTMVPLQALFATMATTLDAYADLVAQRLVVLGGVAWGTARTVAQHSLVPEYPRVILEGSAHVRALAERWGFYATALRGAITRATEVEDAGTAALFTDLSRGIDRQLWVLHGHLRP
jgi:starvation-inducible DNA-binding protein